MVPLLIAGGALLLLALRAREPLATPAAAPAAVPDPASDTPTGNGTTSDGSNLDPEATLPVLPPAGPPPPAYTGPAAKDKTKLARPPPPADTDAKVARDFVGTVFVQTRAAERKGNPPLFYRSNAARAAGKPVRLEAAIEGPFGDVLLELPFRYRTKVADAIKERGGMPWLKVRNA